ncbi:MAG: hypothetical protein JWO19_486 [Bryobacterales bacterium]|nr:hypothetical protein [Bryobacterales bacterium]
MQRTLNINGERAIISVLGAPLEPLFERFYADYFAGRPLPWDEIAVAARDYFDQQVGAFGAHDDYFNNFITLWQRMIVAQLYVEGESVWEQALKPALDWEQAHPGQRLHKGTPYYFWAMTVIMRRDMDRGYLLGHKAFQEDVDSSGQATPDTPGYALVSLNHENLNQAFRAWVVAQAHYLDQRLTDYKSIHGGTLTLADVRQKFLTNPPTIDTLFLFTYTLARLMNITDAPDHTRTNAFAGQLEINILFDLTLVIDAATKKKDNQRYFSDHAAYILAQVGHPLTVQPELGQINGFFINDFDGTLRAALDGTLTLPGKALDRLQCDVALAYGIRNFAAHNTGTAPTIYNRFQEVQQALFRVFFVTIEHLY